MVEKLVKEMYRVNRTSKNGKPYQMLVTVFENGYVLETFLSNEQQYILSNVPLK